MNKTIQTINKHKNKHNNTKLLFTSISIVVALTLILSPIVGIDNAAATKHHKKHKGNFALQSIDQSQSSTQNSNVVSGGNTDNSGNNNNKQTQSNKGNNVLGQIDNDGNNGDGNFADQSISQSQSSDQSSSVVSGGDTKNSGNNSNEQSQSNEGNNVLAQQ